MIALFWNSFLPFDHLTSLYLHDPDYARVSDFSKLTSLTKLVFKTLSTHIKQADDLLKALPRGLTSFHIKSSQKYLFDHTMLVHSLQRYHPKLRTLRISKIIF
jgi:hypothetical protein